CLKAYPDTNLAACLKGMPEMNRLFFHGRLAQPKDVYARDIFLRSVPTANGSSPCPRPPPMPDRRHRLHPPGRKLLLARWRGPARKATRWFFPMRPCRRFPLGNRERGRRSASPVAECHSTPFLASDAPRGAKRERPLPALVWRRPGPKSPRSSAEKTAEKK